MADNTFPILRLPFLALCTILNLYKPPEIIQLSLCSKRSLRVAKQCWKKKGLVKAELSVGRTPCPSVLLYYDKKLSYQFSISGTQNLQGGQTHNIRIGDAVVPSIHKDMETVTYWEDKFSGIQHIVRYIKELFDVPIHSIYLENKKCPNESMNTGSDLVDEYLTHLLDNCEIAGDLYIFGELGTQFRHDWNIHLDGLYLSNGLRFTFQNLTNIDCQSLNLGKSSLRNEDLNQFLKNWQNGGNSRIRYLEVKMNINRDIIKSGIETVPRPRTLQRIYPYMRDISVTIHGGLDIKRNDGTTGTIHLDRDSFAFGVDPINDFDFSGDAVH